MFVIADLTCAGVQRNQANSRGIPLRVGYLADWTLDLPVSRANAPCTSIDSMRRSIIWLPPQVGVLPAHKILAPAIRRINSAPPASD